MSTMVSVASKDLSEDLRLVLQPLENTGIPVQTWTTTNLARHFIKTESFIENVKTITLISSNTVHDNLMSLAIQCGFWSQNSKCTPTTMMKFCNFLKSKQGSQILDDFEKKAAFSSMHVCIDNMLYPWMLSHSIREDVRERYIAEIESEITNQYSWIVMLEKKVKNGLVLVESCDLITFSQYVLLDQKELLKRCYDLIPVSEYFPLDEQELLKRCYDMYWKKLKSHIG